MASAKVMALVIAIVVSAFLTAWAVGSPSHAWVGWLSLLPLFFAIRLVRPWRAFICGGIWGASLFVFYFAAGWPTLIGSPTSLGVEDANHVLFRGPSVVSFTLLTAIPAVYMLLGAWLTRWIGFSPFVLGVGWMGVELALAPLGIHNGLLAGSQGSTVLMSYIGHALGYVLVAFLVAYVNALLVEILRRVPLRLPGLFRRTASGHRLALLKSQILGSLTLISLEPSHPRAPPS